MNESTNFGLKTTGDNDQWRNTLDYHNENMGVIDAVLANNQNALGIIVDGNKAAVSATTGQYIILRNSTITGKTDGLYTAAKSIPANTAIDGTYLTAVSGGGLNALNDKIATTSVTTVGKVKYWKSGNTVSVYVDGASASTTLTTLANLPTGYRPPTTIRARGQAGGYGNDNVQIQITDGGDVKIESSATVALSYGIVTFNAT